MKDPNALRTIGEVSQIINVPVYVIRFWEKKFDLIKPIKRKGGNRYFDNRGKQGGAWWENIGADTSADNTTSSTYKVVQGSMHVGHMKCR